MKSIALGFALSSVLIAIPSDAQVKSGKFKIVRKRSPGSDLISLVGLNNSILLKPALRGDYSYIAAVYAEPKAIVDPRTVSKARVLLSIRVDTITDPVAGRKAALGKLKMLKFIVDGRLLAEFPVTNSSNKMMIGAFYDSPTASWWNVISETGIVDMSRDDLHYLAYAKGVAVKIEGSDLSMVVNERDVTRSFLSNLRKFDLALNEEQAKRSGSSQRLAAPNTIPG